MNPEQLRDYCITKNGSSESFPFGGDVLVFKVAHKMFALIDLQKLPHSVNLKCNPEASILLREKYYGVTQGYHMDKKHWITAQLDSDINDPLLYKLIDDSYALVFHGLPKKVKEIILKNVGNTSSL